MNRKLFEEIKEIFFSNRGYATTREISAKGINRYYINELKNNGKRF